MFQCSARRPGARTPVRASGRILALAVVFTSSMAEAAEPGGLLTAYNTTAIQQETGDPGTGRYDWGPSVMRDGGIYRMWWVRLGGTRQKRFSYAATLPDGERFEFTYSDWGDRIYYAESLDGRQWRLTGSDFSGPPEQFGPQAQGPLMVLAPAESDQERHHVGCPSVIKVADTYYMYYEAPCEYVVNRDADGKIHVGNEYHNQVFLATSADGRQWHKHPDDEHSRPIVSAPEANKSPGRRRYGLGQPSVCYRGGRFVMHYVDSCTGPGDFIIRIEADNPWFENARVFPRSLGQASAAADIPAGAVARFSQTDVKYLDRTFYLVRPAYGTGNLGILATRTGVFEADAVARAPRDVFPQILLDDPRGDACRERLFPRFLTTPEGRILVERGRITLFYSSGLGFKEQAHTWDLRRSEVPLQAVGKIDR